MVVLFQILKDGLSYGIGPNVRWQSSDISMNSNPNVFTKGSKGKILILGGSGFLGSAIVQRAVLEGYSVTSLSRRGRPVTDPQSTTTSDDVISDTLIDYRSGDARKKGTIETILNEGGYTAIVHAIGLLFDDESGLGNLNRLVSGSGSVPDKSSSYDDITRLTAMNAIEAAEAYVRKRMRNPLSTLTQQQQPLLPFVFTSAAEAGWPEMAGGSFVENRIAPTWLQRYLKAKRQVEDRLLKDGSNEKALLRPIIFRPSLIYSLDKIASLPPVGAFFIGNALGLPFVDRPVTVQALSQAVIRAIGNSQVQGVQRYSQIDELNI